MVEDNSPTIKLRKVFCTLSRLQSERSVANQTRHQVRSQSIAFFLGGVSSGRHSHKRNMNLFVVAGNFFSGCNVLL